MANIPISALPNVQPSGYTPNDLLVLVNYDLPSGTTKNTSLLDISNYVLSGVTFTGNTSASCISDLYVTNVYGCSPITIHDSVQSIGSQATGVTSFAFGDNVSAVGDFSHAEGENNIAGVRGFSISDLTNGVITLSNNVDYSLEFIAGGKVYLLDSEPNFGPYTISNTSYSAPDFIINLVDTSINYGNYVVNINNLNNPLADTLLGYGSHSEGVANKSFGDYSHSEGSSNFSVGEGSHSEGKGNQSIGGGSHSEGDKTQSIGRYSHSEGNNTKSIGDYSHAEGISSMSIGKSSHSEGTSTITGAFGFESTGITNGYITLDSKYGNVSSYFTNGYLCLSDVNGLYFGTVVSEISGSTFDGTNTFIQLLYTGNGYNTPYAIIFNVTSYVGGDTPIGGEYSHAEGFLSKSIGNGSHSEGGWFTFKGISNGGTSIGPGSHSEGTQTISAGEASHAEGNNTISMGDYSHAEGYATISTGDVSHAEGESSYSIGYASHSEGFSSKSIGDYSHSEGFETIAGLKTFSFTNIVNGAITIFTNTDFSSEFTSGSVYLIGLSPLFGPYTISGTSYSFPNFIINLDDTTINIGPGRVVDISNLNSSFANTRFGEASHSEGKTSFSFGDYSHSEGGDTISNGNYSHAEGRNTKAIGDNSHSEGEYTIASGYSSHAEGYGSIASGDYSHAEGDGTISIGDYSHSEGSNTIASGDNSHTEGDFSVVISNSSHAEGFNTIVGGLNDDYTSGHAEGVLTVVGFGKSAYAYDNGGISYDSSLKEVYVTGDLTSVITVNEQILIFDTDASYTDKSRFVGVVSAITYSTFTTITLVEDVIGYNIFFDILNSQFLLCGQSNIYGAHAEGYGSIAGGDASHAEGYGSIASGKYSHAEGGGTIAIGNTAHAEGKNTQAIGNFSHAEGTQTISSGSSSHAQGYNTTSIGDSSHASGSGSTASGTTSFVHGSNSIAGGDSTIVLGDNITGITNNTTYVNKLNIVLSGTPSSSLDPQGENGSVLWDDNYFYWKANNQWLRISGSTW